MDDLISMISVALNEHNWIALGVGVIALVVPIVLKVMGKSVPVLDTVLKVAVDLAQKIKLPKAAPKQLGVDAVVPVVEEGGAEVIPLPGQDKPKQ